MIDLKSDDYWMIPVRILNASFVNSQVIPSSNLLSAYQLQFRLPFYLPLRPKYADMLVLSSSDKVLLASRHVVIALKELLSGEYFSVRSPIVMSRVILNYDFVGVTIIYF